MHNKYNEHQHRVKDKGLTLPVYIRDVYLPQHYVNSVKDWFRTPDATERAYEKLKVPVLHPVTVSACD